MDVQAVGTDVAVVSGETKRLHFSVKGYDAINSWDIYWTGRQVQHHCLRSSPPKTPNAVRCSDQHAVRCNDPCLCFCPSYLQNILLLVILRHRVQLSDMTIQSVSSIEHSARKQMNEPRLLYDHCLCFCPSYLQNSLLLVIMACKP